MVTGAARGLGRGIAEAFAAEGATVYAADVDFAAAEAWVGERDRQHRAASSASASAPAPLGVVRPLRVDVSDESDVSAQLARVRSECGGRLHVLVNNAATFHFGSVDVVSREQWADTLDVNVLGYAFMMKHALPSLREVRGSVVNICSISSLVAQHSFVPYSTAKAAQLHMTRLAALDEARHGVRVNAVCSGPILTDATERHARGVGLPVSEVIRQLTSALPLGRMGEPREVAAAVLFLASEEASFTTGAHLMVDGGYTLA